MSNTLAIRSRPCVWRDGFAIELIEFSLGLKLVTELK
jgi:hypothetical protein